MTRNEAVKQQMREEFKAARAQFLANASAFELKLDAFLVKAEVIVAIVMLPFLGRIS